MILVDFTYLNSPGGLLLGQQLLNSIDENQFQNFTLLLDTRNSIKLFSKNINRVCIRNSELSRYLFYKKNFHKIRTVLSFNNLPPPIKLSSNVFIYFHNELLIDQTFIDLPFLKKYLFLLKNKYLKYLNKDTYYWIVQTEHIKKKLVLKLKIKEELILIMPFFKDINQIKFSKNINTFIYPTSDNSHKNNLILINSFIRSALQTNKTITLNITIKDKFLNRNIPDNLIINYLGSISNEFLIDEMFKSEYLIFPSLKESFGLPLIEGAQTKCFILASNLDYVHEIVEVSDTFNPLDENDISRVVLNAIENNDLKEPSIKVSSQLQKILKLITNV